MLLKFDEISSFNTDSLIASNSDPLKTIKNIIHISRELLYDVNLAQIITEATLGKKDAKKIKHDNLIIPEILFRPYSLWI